jgi:DNA primase
MEHEHFTYPEALRWLANKYNIEIEADEERTPEQELAANARESVYLITEFAKKWFEEQMQTDEGRSIGLAYFRERGYIDESIQAFGLGYSPTQRDAFAKAALAKGYNADVLVESGICIKREDGTWYDRFWGRVIFPIYSLSGRVLGFGGRVMQTDAKTAKYLNSPENPIYHKSNILFGLFQAKSAVVKNDEAYLVEGYTDVISLHQIGVTQAVASSGTSLTEEQIRLIKRYTNNVTILYDGDAAGIRASFRGIDMFLQEGMNVRVVLFPDGDDPDSYARKTSPIEFKEFIADNKTDFLRFKAGLLMKDTVGDPIKKAEVIRDIVGSIAKIPNEISRDVYLKESASLLDMDVKVLYAEINHLLANELKEASKRGPAPKLEVVKEAETKPNLVDAAKESLHYEQESALIKLLIYSGNTPLEDKKDEATAFVPTVGQYLIGNLFNDTFLFNNPNFNDIYNLCKARIFETEPLPELSWYIQNENQAFVKTATNLLQEESLSKNYEKHGIQIKTIESQIGKHVEQVLWRLKDVKLKTLMHQIQEQLKAQTDESEAESLKTKYVEYSRESLKVRKLLNRVV